MRTSALSAGTAVAVAVTLALTGVPPAPANTGAYAAGGEYGLGITGSGNHRRPVPGEIQVLRWAVTNVGRRPLTRVRLQVTPPRGWLVRRAPGCRAHGRRLDCGVGRLARRARKGITIRIVVPPRPRLGPVRISATSRAWAGRAAFPGPSTSFQVTVVRQR
jgi:hypothetical protein